MKTQAVWRGGRISVVRSPRRVRLLHQRSGLAEREELAGDTYNGWHGSAPLAELTDVDEGGPSIHPRRREA